MRIIDALPEVFKRSNPMVDAGTSTMVVASLMRFRIIDALGVRPSSILGGENRIECHVLCGYSILLKLFETDPSNYHRFLWQPCENSSTQCASVSVEKDLQYLLNTYQDSKVKIVCAESGDERAANIDQVLIALGDLLPLYENRIFKTELAVGALASPIISLPRSTTLKDTVAAMLSKRIRRIFVSGQKAAISDRGIISYVFSPKNLDEVKNTPEKMLDATIEDVESVEPLEIESKVSAKEAARIIMGNADGFVVCDRGIITTSDLVMKPWRMGRLQIRD